MRIGVLTTQHKKCFVCQHIPAHYQPIVWKNYDYPLLPDAPKNPYAEILEKNQLISYRIFMGHRKLLSCMLLACLDNEFLIFEDDATFSTNDWYERAFSFVPLLKDWDVIALYARAIYQDSQVVNLLNKNFQIPNLHPSWNVRWTNGAVAYLISRSAASKLVHDQYDGTPYDVYLADRYKFIALCESEQFIGHTYKYGSHFHNTKITDED